MYCTCHHQSPAGRRACRKPPVRRVSSVFVATRTMYSTALSVLPKFSVSTALSVFVRIIRSLRPETFNTFFAEHNFCPADYIAYGFADGRPTIKSHLGLYSELTTIDALRRAAVSTQEKLYIEHVTIYLYTHPEKFKVRLLPLPAELEGRFDLRFTLDTMEDFTLLQELYATFHEKTDRSVHALLQLVQSHPDYRARMLENIARNEK